MDAPDGERDASPSTVNSDKMAYILVLSCVVCLLVPNCLRARSSVAAGQNQRVQLINLETMPINDDDVYLTELGKVFFK